jgi:hypothetical protein
MATILDERLTQGLPKTGPLCQSPPPSVMLQHHSSAHDGPGAKNRYAEA